MIKTLTAASVAALSLVALPAAAQDWNGFYVGGFAGGVTTSNDDETVVFDTNLDGTYGDTVNTTAPANAFSPGFCDGSPNGNNAGAGCTDDKEVSGEFGVRFGYDWQTGPLVAGVVLDASKLEAQDGVTAFSTTPANYFFQREVQNLLAVRVRLGFAAGRFLPYITGGYASGEIRDTFSSSNTANSFTNTAVNSEGDGYQIGGGVETMVTDRISLGAEYIFTDLDAEPTVVRVGPGTAPATNPFLLVNPAGTNMRRSSDSAELHSFRITAAYRF